MPTEVPVTSGPTLRYDRGRGVTPAGIAVAIRIGSHNHPFPSSPGQPGTLEVDGYTDPVTAGGRVQLLVGADAPGTRDSWHRSCRVRVGVANLV
jgi:hypothetical protein